MQQPSIGRMAFNVISCTTSCGYGLFFSGPRNFSMRQVKQKRAWAHRSGVAMKLRVLLWMMTGAPCSNDCRYLPGVDMHDSLGQDSAYDT